MFQSAVQLVAKDRPYCVVKSFEGADHHCVISGSSLDSTGLIAKSWRAIGRCLVTVIWACQRKTAPEIVRV